MSEQALRFFQDLPLFREFTQEQVGSIAHLAVPLSLKPGKPLFKEGDPGDALHFIAEGQLRILKTIDAARGTAKSLAVLQSGNFVGEMTLLDGAPRSASALAEDATQLFMLRRTDFETLLTQDPVLAIRFVSALFSTITERRLRTALELIVLYEMGLAMGKEEDLERIPLYFLEVVTKALKVKRGLLILHNTLSDRYQVELSIGQFEKDPMGLPLNRRHPLLQFLMNDLQGICFHNYFKTHFFRTHTAAGFEEEAMLISPLLVGGTFIGAVVLFSEDNTAFDAAGLNLLMGVSSMAAAAIHRATELRNRANKTKLGHKRFSI